MILDALAIRRRKAEKDSHAKSALKAVSWRLVGTVDTIVISYIITGELKMALSIGSVEVITKMVLYFIHERVWNRYA